MAKRDGKSKHINPGYILAGAAGAGLLSHALGRGLGRNLIKEKLRKIMPSKVYGKNVVSFKDLKGARSKRNREILSNLDKLPKNKNKSPATVIDFEAAKKRLEKRGSFWNGFQKAMEDDFYG